MNIYSIYLYKICIYIYIYTYIISGWGDTEMINQYIISGWGHAGSRKGGLVGVTLVLGHSSFFHHSHFSTAYPFCQLNWQLSATPTQNIVLCCVVLCGLVVCLSACLSVCVSIAIQ